MAKVKQRSKSVEKEMEEWMDVDGGDSHAMWRRLVKLLSCWGLGWYLSRSPLPQAQPPAAATSARGLSPRPISD
jgi:hypothetical protein